MSATPPGKKTSRRVIAIVLLGTLGPVVAAVILRIFVFEAFKVPAGSMMPTLSPGDHMFVRKWKKTPSPGEVVVFRYPDNPSQDFVKRVVASAGDTIEVVDGRTVLNGKLAPHCHVGTFTTAGRPFELYLEKVGGQIFGVLHTRKLDDRSCETDACPSPLACHAGICAETTQGPWTVPPNELWVLGDNRDNSHDSRMWNGGKGRGVPLDNVIGQPSFVFFSETQGRSGKDVAGIPVVAGANASLQSALNECVTTLSR